MFNLEQSLLSYLTAKNTDYAIEINGKWGVGKTHYIKDFMEVQEDAMEKEMKKFIYLSCNGIQTIEDFQTRLLNSIVRNNNTLMESLGKAHNYLNKYADLLDSKFSIATRLTGDILNKVNTDALEAESKYRFILVLDDLERKSDNLSSKDLFGFVSSFCLDSYNMKVIFIANEEKITNKESDFNLIKEKIIFNTFSFEYSSKDIVKEIIDNRFEGRIYEILDRTWLNSSFAALIKEENPNLRTILFIISSFGNLINKLDEQDDSNYEQIYKMIICNLIIISINYKNGTLKRVEELEPLYSQKKVFSNIPNEDSYSGKILSKYRITDLDIKNHIYFSRAISELVINGYLDIETYNREINEYIEVHIEEKVHEDTPEEKAMDILVQFRDYTEAEVKEAQFILYESLTYVNAETLKTCNTLHQHMELKLFFLEKEAPLIKIIEALQSENYDADYFKMPRYLFDRTFDIYCSNMKQQKHYDKFKILMYRKFININHNDFIEKIKDLILKPFNMQHFSIRSEELSEINMVQIINETPIFLKAILEHPSKVEYFKYLIHNSADYFTFNPAPSELLKDINKLLENIDTSNISAESDKIDEFKLKEFVTMVAGKKREVELLISEIEAEKK